MILHCIVLYCSIVRRFRVEPRGAVGAEERGELPAAEELRRDARRRGVLSSNSFA